MRLEKMDLVVCLSILVNCVMALFFVLSISNFRGSAIEAMMPVLLIILCAGGCSITLIWWWNHLGN